MKYYLVINKPATQAARTPLTDGTPSTRKIYPFSKITIPIESISNFDVLNLCEIVSFITRIAISNPLGVAVL